ncbi:MAG: hypothetical protein ABMB14_31055, partial [Myxococcota bacterium]
DGFGGDLRGILLAVRARALARSGRVEAGRQALDDARAVLGHRAAGPLAQEIALSERALGP